MLAENRPIRGIRGATTLTADNEDEYRQELPRLMLQLLADNGITEADIVTVFCTVTADLTCISPARVIREALGWSFVPLFCAQEPIIDNMPPRCVRVLVQCYTHMAPTEIKHVYHNQAALLRPDLASA
jgi:chorismate mutase